MREDWLTRRKHQIAKYIVLTHLAGLLICMAALGGLGRNSYLKGTTVPVTWLAMIACLLVAYWVAVTYLHKDLLPAPIPGISDWVAYALLAAMFVLVLLSAGDGGYLKLLLLLPVIVTATARGRLLGVLTAFVAGGSLILSGMLLAHNGPDLNQSLETDLIFVSLALLVGWFVGGLSQTEIGTEAVGAGPENGGCPEWDMGCDNGLGAFNARLQREMAEQQEAKAILAVENARLFGEAQGAYERLREIQQQLFHAQKLEAVGQLAASVAHELNNQLSVIQACIDLYCSKANRDDAVYRSFLRIGKAARMSASLTRQLLLLGRQVPQRKSPLSLNDSVIELTDTLGDILSSRQIALNLDLEDGLWQVNADGTSIDQMVVNLVINARDAMPQGGTVTIRTRNLVLDGAGMGQTGVSPGGRFVLLSVTDTGVGMDEQTRSRIFEPFFSTKGPGKGTGLGLAITHSIIKNLDGWIDVRSRPGEGSCFEIYLPAAGAGCRALKH
jgi:signal transduction histidine kinase